jgi:hypothetical protein
MTDRKQSALSRRLDRLSKSQTDASISSLETNLTSSIVDLNNTLSLSIAGVENSVNNINSTLYPGYYPNNFGSFCNDLTIDLDALNSILTNGPGLLDPNLGTGYETPSVGYGVQGYFTTYVFSCSSDGNWTPGDKIKIRHPGGCSINATIISHDPETFAFSVRIYYPLPSSCSGSQTGWEIINRSDSFEQRVLCCVVDMDGGWCPIGEGNPDLSTLWENVIDGGNYQGILDIPVISGGYS